MSSPIQTQRSKALPDYRAPSSGLLAHLPSGWVPFAELTRIDRPTGIYLFYFPHLFGTLYASAVPPNDISLLDLAYANAILLVGTTFFRAAACTWNDNMDREYDRQVLRCRLRPLARKAVSPNQAHIFTAFLTSLALLFLYMLPQICWVLSLPSIALLVLYPFAKRFTDFPQVILGIQVGIGFFMGLGAVESHLLQDLGGLGRKDWAIASFYAANVCWTIVYDTVYAQQDVEDDAKAGVRSMAVHFRGKAKTLLGLVSTLQVSLLLLCAYSQGFGSGYKMIACGGTAVSLGYMLTTIDLANPSECMWWFKNICWFVGGAVSVGLASEHLSWPWSSALHNWTCPSPALQRRGAMRSSPSLRGCTIA